MFKEAEPCVWNTPAEMPELERGQVHVWRVCLNDAVPFLPGLISILSVDEKNRAERYRIPMDRHHFMIARGVLRILLGSYLDMKPDKLRFSYGPHDKPILLPAQPDGRTLHFNISHSHGLGLCAITRGRELGVDLERIRPEFITEQIPEHFFTPQEAAKLRALPASLQETAFFKCWTRKEAYLKAKGAGLSLELDRFEVSFVPGEPASILNTCDDPNERDRWSLFDLDPGPGYAGALAVEGLDLHLRCFHWNTYLINDVYDH